MKSKKFIALAAVMGFLGVAFGAFGVHGLKEHLSSGMMEIYKTGVQYHLIHSVVLLVLAFWGGEKFSAAFYFIFFGIFLFSFSLYLYSITALTFFAIVTPFGGVSFMVGWILIIVTAVRSKSSND